VRAALLAALAAVALSGKNTFALVWGAFLWLLAAVGYAIGRVGGLVVYVVLWFVAAIVAGYRVSSK
jgi:hypothetical protein